MAYISKNLQHSGKRKSVRLLRPWRGTKLFSTSKTVFINMSIAVDFCIRTLYDQICVYARFINEAPGLSRWVDYFQDSLMNKNIQRSAFIHYNIQPNLGINYRN